MFDNVLVSMALSPATVALVSALPGLREFGTKELTLVHATKPPRGTASQAIDHIAELRGRLNRLAEDLRAEGFGVSVHIPTGSPAHAVVEAAHARDPDIVLVGSRSRTLIHDAFVGSVAWDIVRHAGRPVLLQRIEPSRTDPEAALVTRGTGFPNHVVYPTDFSETAERAWPWVLQLADGSGPSFTLLHVLSVEDGRRKAQERLEELGDQLRGRGVTDVECRVRVGSHAAKILSAGGYRADAMVVMGTRGLGILPGALLGSVGRQILRNATSRVLLVPPGSDTE